MDARGNITGETHGNGLTTTRGYYAQSGFIQSIVTGSTPINNRQSLIFTFDKLGNLIDRDDAIKDMTEVYVYDTLNRLTQTNLDQGNSQVQTVNITYDALGNITSKTGATTGDRPRFKQQQACFYLRKPWSVPHNFCPP